jgi:putative addiction module component (TIGR02574 family)
MSTAQLAETLKALPAEEKNTLLEIIAADLVDSAPSSVRAAQVDELLRRRQAWLDGRTKLIPGDQMMGEMREMLERL